MSRTQLTLGGVLLLQLLLILFVRSPFTGASTGVEARPLLPELEAITPARLQIDGTGDERITLVRGDSGWTIDEAGGFPADATKVEDLLADLRELTVRRPVVSSDRYHEAFKVSTEGYEGRIRLYTEGDDPAADLILGTSANYRSTHVRSADEDPVFEVQGLAPYDVRPDTGAWIEKQLVAASADAVTRIALTNGSGRFELERAEDGWTLLSPTDERAPDAEVVEALLQAATSIQLNDAAGPLGDASFGLDAPAATVTLTTADGELTVTVGGKVEGEDAKRYVTRSGLGFAGIAWDSALTRLLEDKLEDLFASADVSG